MSDSNWHMYCEQARAAADEGNYGYAETTWMVALLEAADLGPDDERMIATLEGLGDAYWNQGKYRQAEKPTRQVLESHQKTRGENHLDTGNAAHNLAKVYHMQQKYGQAEPLYQKAMTIKTKLLGADDPDVMRLVEGLSDLLMRTHREAEAENLIKCVRGTASGVSSQKPDNSTSQQSAPAVQTVPAASAMYASPPLTKAEAPVGTAHKTWEELEEEAERAYEAGDMDLALTIWHQAIALSEQFEASDTRLAQSLDRTGDILSETEKYGQAEMVWWRALQIKLKELGPSHASVADTGNCLAGLHYLMGRYSEAENYSKRCLEIYQTCYGPDHPNVAVCMHNLAMLYHVQGRYPEAEDQYKGARALRVRVLGLDDPDTISVTKSYADLLKTLGRETEANDLYEAASGLITGSWKAVEIDDDLALTEKSDHKGAKHKKPDIGL